VGFSGGGASPANGYSGVSPIKRPAALLNSVFANFDGLFFLSISSVPLAGHGRSGADDLAPIMFGEHRNVDAGDVNGRIGGA
jgi:hypothetical protein